MANLVQIPSRLVCGLAAMAILGACGDNLDESVGRGAPSVALDRTAVPGAPADISKCGRFPSRC